MNMFGLDINCSNMFWNCIEHRVSHLSVLLMIHAPCIFILESLLAKDVTCIADPFLHVLLFAFLVECLNHIFMLLGLQEAT